MDLDFQIGLDSSGTAQFEADTVLAEDLARSVCHSLNEEPLDAMRILLRLSYYRKHLEEVAQHRPPLLEHFRSRFQNVAGDAANFYGNMFEVEIAASLLRNGISFEKQESPDFQVEVGEEAVGVECTIGRLGGGGLPLKKLEGRVKKKGRRDYIGLSDAVFVDATGALFASAGGGTPKMRRTMESNMKRFMSMGVHKAGVGAAVAFHRMVHDSGHIETIYSRVDHFRAESSLKWFLDDAYPYGEKSIDPKKIAYLHQN